MLSGDTGQSAFAEWGLLYVRYCDGGSFTGLRSSPAVINGTAVYYRGRAILDAVLADAAERHGLGAARRVVLTGGSAGGTATVANCDHVASVVAPARARCVADAGFFLDTPNAMTGPSKRGKTKNKGGHYETLARFRHLIYEHARPEVRRACR